MRSNRGGDDKEPFQNAASAVILSVKILLTEAGPLVSHVVMAKVDQSSLLALKGMIHAEALTTPITVRREVERGEAEAESQVILKLILAESVPLM
jgi:hypothetical protein